MSNGKRWTKREERLLVKYRTMGMYFDEVGELLDRSEKAIRSRWKVLGQARDRRYTAEQKKIVADGYGKRPAAEIAAQIGRTITSVYQQWNKLGLCRRRRDLQPLLAFIREKHPLGWSDAEVAAAWNEEHPNETVSREWVTEVRRDKCGLPHNALSDHRRRKVAEKTKEQLAAAGVESLAEVRAIKFREFATRHGWPADLRPRQVQILDRLYQHGPATRQQICADIGMTWRTVRSSLKGNDPEGSYLANLIARGLVVRTRRAVRRPGQGQNVDLYSIAPHVIRGPICPIEPTTVSASSPWKGNSSPRSSATRPSSVQPSMTA